ncbi:MAG: hypothetical protein HYR55_17610 [Acidobacteria bacterium]|nr:hypothetical protein [Acidobacteriota bacterium]MBI3655423.1 hypothetical protein [Acidobacteriota bacterium]
MKVRIQLNDTNFRAGVAIANQVRVAETAPELCHRLKELVQTRSTENFPLPETKEAVRALLRKGGFKPSGRNKPASEYLAQAARESRFPFINNLVDVNNFLSLQYGFPISLLDRSCFGETALIRYGAPGEKYVFNSAGQEIDLARLICICAEEAEVTLPLGNPIKDSLAGKIKPDTTAVIGVIYASARAISSEGMAQLAEEFARLLGTFGGAASTTAQVLIG